MSLSRQSALAAVSTKQRPLVSLGLYSIKSGISGPVTACFGKGLDQVFPGGGIIVLKGKFIAVAKRAAGNLVGTDFGGKILGILDKLHRLFPDCLLGRGETAIAKLRFGLDIDIYCCDLEIVFVEDCFWSQPRL